MKNNRALRFFRVLASDSGQALLPWMFFGLVAALGMGGVTVDLGRAYVAYQELQASTDAAALAGAYAMSSASATTSSVQTVVTNYSSASGGKNANPNLTNVVLNTPVYECLTTITNRGVLCSGSPLGDNAIQVTQTASVPTYFIRVLSALGIKSATSIPLSATATASMYGASASQYNLAIVVDTTNSMGNTDTDPNCSKTRITCALSGVETLLQALTPCPPTGTCTTCTPTSKSCTPFDQVSIFTFPNVEASTASDDTTCPTSNPTIVPYYNPTPGATWSAPSGNNATYQVTPYLSDYSSTNKSGGTLSTSSELTIATGGKSGCQGMQTPGGDGTYYAGVIYAAQSSLMAAQKANPGSLNAMIILSDGDADSSKICKTWSSTSPGTCTAYATSNGTTYGSSIDQCQQAINAAQYATGQGTTVYTIAYGAASSGCASDTSGSLKGLSPCTAMQDMASSPGNFYSDSTASQNKGQCPSTNGGATNLAGIFTDIALSLTNAGLIPNNTQ